LQPQLRWTFSGRAVGLVDHNASSAADMVDCSSYIYQPGRMWPQWYWRPITQFDDMWRELPPFCTKLRPHSALGSRPPAPVAHTPLVPPNSISQP